jgi:methylenetetrahydrofolate reductase (NADPH)
MATRATGCPKRMQFGPCGGVHGDGRCEMAATPCVFDEPVAWTDEPARVTSRVQAPLVLTDFSAPPFDPAALRRTALVLSGSCDAVLVGEHQNRPDFPPTLMSQLLLDTGLTPWITLACRDRNRIVLEQELRGVHRVGVSTVLCVTGDGRGYDVRPEVTQVFDLDGTRLAALAASVGLLAAVVETPGARPAGLRPYRLLQKQHAGASAAVLNHAGSATDVAAFMLTARAAGLRIPVLAAVAVFTDPLSAAVLDGLPGLELDRDRVAAVLGARDPVTAGIEAAVAEAAELLDIEGVEGINVSGLASERGHLLAAEIKAEVGARVRLAAG